MNWKYKTCIGMINTKIKMVVTSGKERMESEKGTSLEPEKLCFLKN